ncbi:MAG: FAD-dependent monooxygenase [Planctomycetota bacterium]|nr:FAD-dependent monooxygenase [Planctomycetota bacterium]
MRSVILGGGVSGCAVAAALRGTPLEREAVILEQSHHASSFDLGVLLNQTGLTALDIVAPEFNWRHSGRLIHSVVLRSSAGRTFSETPVDACVAMRGADFGRMLRDAAGGVAFLEGWSFAGLDRAADGTVVGARLADGGGIDGDAFFACDGSHSRARHLVFPESHLSDTVVEEIVGIADAPAVAARLGHSFHKFHDEEGGLAIELLPLNARAVACFLQFDPLRWTLVSRDPAALRAFAQERAAGWAPEVQEAIGCLDYARARLVQTRDLPPLDELSTANIALIGDAAHAALPFTSQSANDALADAALLNNLLHDVADREGVRAAFERYSEIRWPHHHRRFKEGRELCREFLAPVPKSGPRVPLVA